MLILPSSYKDVDDLANDTDIIYEDKQKILGQSIDGMTFVVDKFISKYDITNPVEKKKITNELFDIISNIADLSILQMYIEMIAIKIRTDTNILFSQYKIRLQQARQNITRYETKPTKQELDTKSLFDSFIKDGFYKTQFDEDSLIKIKDIIFYYEQIQKVLKDHNVTEPKYDEDNYLANQLWRESQFENMSPQRKLKLVSSFGHRTIDDLLKKILKLSSIDQETKLSFLNNRKKI